MCILTFFNTDPKKEKKRWHTKSKITSMMGSKSSVQIFLALSRVLTKARELSPSPPPVKQKTGDGHIITMRGWRLKNYIKNPVVLFCHKYDEPAIAACVKILKTKDSLVLTHKFPRPEVYPKADIVYALYADKIMRGSSVGFLPIKWKAIKDKDGRTILGRKFKKQELLEHSLVNIPSNPEALMLEAIKSVSGNERSKELLFQQIRTGLNEQSNELANVKSELASISAGGPELVEDSGNISVQVRRGFNINDKQRKEKDMEKQKGFPLPNPDGKTVEEPTDRIYFRDKDGVEHKAITINETFQSLAGVSDFEERVSAGNMIRAHILGDFNDLNKTEKELMQKAQQEGTGSLGGFMLPSPVSSQIIDLARNKMQVMKAGARTMKMDSGELTLVKVLTDPTSYWRAESEAITESDGTFENLFLKPMVVGSLIRVSMELLSDASNAGSMLENMMAASLALEQDRVALLGTGVNEPMGLDVATGVEVISMGTNGATPADYDEFSEAAQKVAENNGEAKAMIMAPRTYFTLDRLKAATTNQPLVAPASYQALNKYYTNQIPITDTKGSYSACSKAYVGDFSNLLFAMRNDITIEGSKSGGGSAAVDSFARMEILIRCYARLAIAITRENHFCKIEGIKP